MDDQPNKAGYTLTQCHLGGKARAATARRHPAYGIFLPNVPLFEDDNLFPTCYQHGREGGKARAMKAHRDSNGRFVKENNMSTEERIAELEEKKSEFILEHSDIGQRSVSWGELAELQARAESQWNETDDGKELKALLDDENDDYGYAEQKNFD